jgi:hypothetical protein
MLRFFFLRETDGMRGYDIRQLADFETRWRVMAGWQ